MEQNGRARVGGGIADPLTGRLLDRRYRIGPRIARGGMASVYEATDLRLDRTCAVKVMHPGLGNDDDFANRFVREARAAARLSHPHVVGVFDQGDDEGVVFLVMEYVPGHTLRDVIRKESPLPPIRALALLEPVLSALAAAHRAGLVHRDVKPENVLISDEQSGGRVKVADFGLAKAVSADTQHTATGGVLIGTVSYLAPELVVDGRADARADVYAAGVMLYEMLTGRKPHEGESPIAVAYKHVHDDVPPPSAAVPGIPPYVDALVARATSRDQAQRPADAGVLLHQVHRVSQALAEGVSDDEELTRDLALTQPIRVSEDTSHLDVRTVVTPAQVAAHGVPVAEPVAGSGAEPVARPVAGPPRPPRPRRSRRGPVLLLVALLIAVAAGAGAWWFGYARYTATPGVLGLSQAAATTKLEHAGLDVRVAGRSYSETVRQGRVLGTDPGPGSRVRDGGTVGLTLSLGRERYDVPKLAGLTENRAQDRVQAAHFTYGTSTRQWSETVGRGLVIRSNPAKGTSLKPQTAVDVVISRGPRPISVGSWVGKPVDRASRALQGRGLQVDASQREYSDSVPAGSVISQQPRGGTLTRGMSVTFVVSRGPELVRVPDDLVAQGVDAATQELQALGFKVTVVRSDYYIGVNYVYSTDPSGGAMVPRGSTIRISVI